MTKIHRTVALAAVAALALVACGGNDDETLTYEQWSIREWLNCGIRTEIESPAWEECVEPFDWAVRGAPATPPPRTSQP